MPKWEGQKVNLFLCSLTEWERTIKIQLGPQTHLSSNLIEGFSSPLPPSSLPLAVWDGALSL